MSELTATTVWRRCGRVELFGVSRSAGEERVLSRKGFVRLSGTPLERHVPARLLSRLDELSTGVWRVCGSGANGLLRVCDIGKESE